MNNGEFVQKKVYLDYVQVNGCYNYKRTTNQLGEWIMAGEIFIHKVLTDEEIRKILNDKGYAPMPRKDGDIDLSKYGF